jgi:protein O-GlcNAc transferase
MDTSESDALRGCVQACMRLFGEQRFAEAEALLRAAQRLDGKNAEIAYHLGNTLASLGRAREAAIEYERCVAERTDFAPAFHNLGNVRHELGDLRGALSAFEAAIALRPDAVIAIANCGLLLHELGRSDEAERMLRRGLAVDASYATLHVNLGLVLKDSGDAAGALESLRTACELAPESAHAHSVLLYTMSFVTDDPAQILAEARRWQQRHGGVPVLPSAVRLEGQRLRVGYLSPDFRDHCQTLFMLPLLSHHDRSAFEVTCYSLVTRPDDYTRRLQALVEHWVDVAGSDDAALAARIHHDRLDILIDLAMHMGDGRPQVLARKPAPVQIAWLAYPGTTGLSAIDYRLSDPRLDPPTGSDACYSERTLRLPETFWCYDPLGSEPQPNALPARSQPHLTLGCLNNPCKLTDRTLSLWAPVLRALPQTRLVLLAPAGGAARARLAARLARAGITPERVRFVGHQPRTQYLLYYHLIDLCLDTLPYNGHTTSLDAFWMGVPVITRIGGTCAGRAGLSQLHQLGLSELAADSDAAFVDIVVALAHDLPRLAALRAQLRARLAKSSLMDAPRFARNLEAIYHRLRTPSAAALP